RILKSRLNNLHSAIPSPFHFFSVRRLTKPAPALTDGPVRTFNFFIPTQVFDSNHTGASIEHGRGEDINELSMRGTKIA
ncbi:MAG TPA: hypothetical protein VIC84_05895, partial [Blastocatellia bacterium]